MVFRRVVRIHKVCPVQLSDQIRVRATCKEKVFSSFFYRFLKRTGCHGRTLNSRLADRMEPGEEFDMVVPLHLFQTIDESEIQETWHYSGYVFHQLESDLTLHEVTIERMAYSPVGEGW